MNNKLIIQLIRNNVEEIQKLVHHFQNEENDLKAGFPLLESRLDSLNKDIEVLKLNLEKEETDCTSRPIESESKADKEANSIIEEAVISVNLIESTEIDDVELVSESNHVEEKLQISDPVNNNNETAVSTLNDKLQVSRGNNLQEKIQKSKLVDIQSAIGINDQFLFIRELFNNKSEDYKSAINYINTQNDCNDIIDHFNRSMKWDNEEDTVIQFFDLIKRKFE